MLPKKQRISPGLLKKAILKVFETEHLLIKRQTNDKDFGRFAVVVKRTVEPLAVKRNIWKRTIYRFAEKTKSNNDYLFIVKKRLPKTEISKEVEKMFEKIN